jgi:hypothetical protein
MAPAVFGFPCDRDYEKPRRSSTAARDIQLQEVGESAARAGDSRREGIYGKRRTRLNSGQTGAVYTELGLGGAILVSPKSP